jgi:PHS family inorganic phosphate transporter-like MFS transporter
LPIIGYLYWPEDSSSHHETGINCATLAGTIIGQVALGIAADRKGRKKVYGYEMLIVGVGSVVISMASTGLIPPGSPPRNGSMSITAWLVVLRLVIGFGVGAEYPITAAITSE